MKQPKNPFHPGEILLEEFLAPAGIMQTERLPDVRQKRTARTVPYRLLDLVEQVGDPASGNLLIQGDDLEALKALRPFYATRVKCIYIDPPHNTKDSFEHYGDNLEYSQRLSMLYPHPGLQCPHRTRLRHTKIIEERSEHERRNLAKEHCNLDSRRSEPALSAGLRRPGRGYP